MALSQGTEAFANLELLRQRLREALFAKKQRLRELADLCKAQRAELRGWIRQRRAQSLKDLRDELRRERDAAAAMRRVRLQEARRSSTSTIELARAAMEIERAHAAEQLRIGRAHDTKRVAVDKAHARSLSDELMSASTLKRLAPLLDKARGIRPAPGESRTEALWRYARSHPEEMHALLEPHAERTIAQTRKEIATAEEAIRAGGGQARVQRTQPLPTRSKKAPKPAHPKRAAKTSRPHAPPRPATPPPTAPTAPIAQPQRAIPEPSAPRSPARPPPPAGALGQGRRGQPPDKVHRSLAALSVEGQRLTEDRRAGKITSAQMNDGSNALERRRQALVEKTRTPKYEKGDILEHRTGERAVVESVGRSDSGGVLYRILRGPRGDVRDMWHAESIVRKVSARKARAPAVVESKSARAAHAPPSPAIAPSASPSPARAPRPAKPAATEASAPPIAHPVAPATPVARREATAPAASAPSALPAAPSPPPPPRPQRSLASRSPRPQLGLDFNEATTPAAADRIPPPESARQPKAGEEPRGKRRASGSVIANPED